MSCRAVMFVLVTIAVGRLAVKTDKINDCLKTDETCTDRPPPAVIEKHGSPDDIDLETEFPCKEATKTILRWKSDKTEIFGSDEHNRYLVKAYLVNAEDNTSIKVSEQYSDPQVRAVMFSDLKPNSTYKFGIFLRTDNNSKPFEILTKDTFHTLVEDHLSLSTITYSNVSDCVSYGGLEVKTNFTWTPVPENVCMYEIVVFNRNGSLYGDFIPMHLFTRAQDYTKVEIPELHYDCYMSVAVYATNPVAEGEKYWIDFKTPHCVEFHDWDYTICTPKKPENLTVTVENCELKLDWADLDHPPPATRIVVVPANPNRSNFTINSTIEGGYHEFMAPTGQLGEYMNVYVQAISRAGGSPIAHGGVENHCPPHHVPVAAHLPMFTPAPPTTTSPPPPQHHLTAQTTIVVVLVTLLVVFILAVLALSGYKAYKKWKPDDNPVQHEYEMHQPLAGNKGKESEGDQSPGDTSESDEFEVSRQNLNIGEVIGEDDASDEERKQLKMELEVMKSVGSHNNIVCLVGFCSPNHMLVVEYCSMGDLQNYLRDVWRSKNWAKAVYNKNNSAPEGDNKNVVSNLLYNTDAEKKKLNITVFDLISLARQVALGMEHLSSNKVVHRDLAARNILLNSNFTAKISDFGLSRDVYEENMYRHKGVRRLPVKWMAIECLVHQMFTTQSDVWSFGILLWEIMTLGGCPYPTLQSPQVYQSLQRGERLERPKLCPKDLYDIMNECWDAIPHQRPTFTVLVRRLEDIMMLPDGNHEYLELNEVLVSYAHLYEFSKEEETADVPDPVQIIITE